MIFAVLELLFLLKLKLIKTKYDNIERGLSAQTQRAVALHALAGVRPGECGLEEIRQFQDVLPNYQIAVVSAEHNHAIIFKGEKRDQQLVLLYHDGHYDTITSLTGF